jgi:hypothetical protein
MYVTEASALVGREGCPHCGVAIPNDQWRAEKDKEGEILMWQHMCSCGTLLKVFND